MLPWVRLKTASVPFHMSGRLRRRLTSITVHGDGDMGAFGAVRVLYAFILLGAWSGMLWLIAVATMTVGNIMLAG
jgi:hypothetical protein